ncbi:MAG: zinc-binding alcohol dehydrogenase [Ignavibacteriales bacterium]|nr:zinc-binding alcohol dehydrogenase [Ignavibacteriales bacterium]
MPVRSLKWGASIKEFKVGDRVACGGSGAVHAEIVSVPKNLCVKLPDNVETKTAAFSTIASIAIQGIRQVQLSFGESCLVIGLGLIGQITLQVLSAAGIKAIGVDVSAKQVDFANKLGFGKSFNRDDLNLEKNIYHLTGGFGVDGVIITAATASLDPINFAGKVCRQKRKSCYCWCSSNRFCKRNYYKKSWN